MLINSIIICVKILEIHKYINVYVVFNLTSRSYSKVKIMSANFFLAMFSCRSCIGFTKKMNLLVLFTMSLIITSRLLLRKSFIYFHIQIRLKVNVLYLKYIVKGQYILSWIHCKVINMFIIIRIKSVSQTL